MSRKTTLSAAIGLMLSGAALNANANLTSSATLNFTLGSTTNPDCPGCPSHISDIYGSYFAMDTNGNGIEANEKTPISSFNGIHIGSSQAAGGSHTGGINGSESQNIDAPWTFFGSTGMHQTTSPITATSVTANGATLDMSGWNWTWYGIPSIPLVQQGAAIMNCTPGSSCSDSSSYTLDAAFHVNGGGFTTVSYALHLEGHVSSIPVPPAAWLFGSGLLGLIGIARKKTM